MPSNVAASVQPSAPPEAKPRPFLKWAGGKGQLLEQFAPLLPARDDYNAYFEPFVGGAAVFFWLRPPRAALTDINEELIGCYTAIRDDVEGVIQALQAHRYDEQHYYETRDVDPAGLYPAARAARTIYLNKTGFNGLYRVNRAGRFNVPFGRYTNPQFRDEENLRACARALRDVELAVRDFEAVLDFARAGDFVYFDPPYSPVSSTANFTSYVPGGFGWDRQERLAVVFEELTRRGVRAMLSNSDVPELHALYEGHRIDIVQASRHINSKATGRGKVGEIVVRNYDETKGRRRRARRP